jgi:CBS domain-containing protein
MSNMVVIIGAIAPASEAARLMRKHRFNHMVVTDNGRAVAMLSSFDLLKLLEESPA